MGIKGRKIMADFHERFHILLKENPEIKPIDLSIKTGIDKASISKYWNNKNVPNSKNLALIANFFNVSPVWLMGATFDRHSNFNQSLNYSGENPTKVELLNLINQILNDINDESKLQQIKMFLETYIEK